ncbi:MAG: hypothetical protein L0216_00005, partial [Planctomycetales bacterium]|nr:hypothetical protein [Planctomycetales bacterium]
IEDWRSGVGERPTLAWMCAACATQRVQAPCPDKVSAARVEYRLPSGRVADVVLLSGDTPVFALEVRHTHAVPDEKRADIGLRWMEVEAQAILWNPTTWSALAGDVKAARCESCKHPDPEPGDVTRYIIDGVDTRRYLAGEHDCWKCGNRVTVYTWTGHQEVGTDRPPDPIPPTVRRTYHREMGEYLWLNHCSTCDAVQGDGYLHSGVDGPFFGVDPETLEGQAS